MTDRLAATSATVRLLAVGDIMLGDSPTCVGFGFHSRYRASAASALTSATPLLRRGDIVIGNLECLLSTRGRGTTRLERDQMRGSPSSAKELREAGFTAINVANNHAMQHGAHAFAETVTHLRMAGLDCVGLRGTGDWCATPCIQTTASGLTVGLLGYSWRPRQYDQGPPLYAEGDVDGVAADVARLAQMTDCVVVSLHWGEEFLGLASEREVAAARRIIDEGACVLVGHHPHVRRPVERYGRGVICYSLGNFVTDMLWQPALREGAVLDCRLERGAASRATTFTSRVDASYRAIVADVAEEIPSAPVGGLPEQFYEAAVRNTVMLQRRALYAYVARNAYRFPPLVLAQLAFTTARNKLEALIARFTAAKGQPAAGDDARRE